MEIKTLRYFAAVAREENMTKAAEQLHVTQPTLSKALKSLEDELGKKLFVRHSFNIQLTDEGILLRKRAADLLDMADKIFAEFQTLDDITGGDIYFGLAESYQIRHLARILLLRLLVGVVKLPRLIPADGHLVRHQRIQSHDLALAVADDVRIGVSPQNAY